VFAAAAAVLIWWVVRPAPRLELALAGDIVRTPSARRATGATAGDLWRLRATTGRLAHVELRVFRDRRELILRCPEASCQRDGDRLEATLTLAPGRYEAFLVASDAPLPAPAEEVGRDLDALTRAGARIVRISPLLVW
jgi:hypothetical protein